LDHSLGVLRSIALRHMTGMKSPKIYLPEESCDAFRDVLRAFDRLEDRNRDKEGLFLPVKPGDSFSIGRGINANVFRVRHTAISVGFQLNRTKMVLKDEFRSLTGPEIGQRVRSGVQVKKAVTENLLSYIGDSNIETLDDHPEVLDSSRSAQRPYSHRPDR
jgi:hypothetical protein